MKTFCSICSATSRSDCPALGSSICGSCCGGKRNSAIKCTADCRFNPFSTANYDGWLRIDSALVRKMMEYLAQYYSELQFKRVVQEMRYDDDSPHADAMGSAAAVYYLLFAKPFKVGKTVAELWKQEGWGGLNGDEKAMMECRMGSAPALVEVQKVLDHQAMECLDLLNPERGVFVVLDRNMAKDIPRFSRIWMWLVHYPYFSRPAGDPLSVPDRMERVLLDKILFDTLKERGKRSGASRNAILAKNFGRYARLICKESRKMHQQMLNAMDLCECKAFYGIKGSREEVKKVLDSKPEFRVVGEAKKGESPWPALTYDWLRLGESKIIEKKMSPSFRHDDADEMVGILGRVFLGEKEIIVQTMSRLKFYFAKPMVERYWGKMLEFRREAIVDVAKQMAQRGAEGLSLAASGVDDEVIEEAEIPREIEEKLALEYYRKHYETFLKDAIPALDGMTPGKAAKSVKMRPRLIELMKSHIHGIDSVNKDRGFSISIAWVLDRLGLDELR